MQQNKPSQLKIDSLTDSQKFCYKESDTNTVIEISELDMDTAEDPEKKLPNVRHCSIKSFFNTCPFPVRACTRSCCISLTKSVKKLLFSEVEETQKLPKESNSTSRTCSNSSVPPSEPETGQTIARNRFTANTVQSHDLRSEPVPQKPIRGIDSSFQVVSVTKERLYDCGFEVLDMEPYANVTDLTNQ